MIIDIEQEMFNHIAPILRGAFNGISVSGEYVHAPSTFPHVSIIEQDNNTHEPTLLLTNIPVACNLLYEINVYSNKSEGKKQEAKEIIDVIDTEMVNMGFVRTFMNPVSNLENATIYRIVARYTKLQTQGGI